MLQWSNTVKQKYVILKYQIQTVQIFIIYHQFKWGGKEKKEKKKNTSIRRLTLCDTLLFVQILNRHLNKMSDRWYIRNFNPSLNGNYAAEYHTHYRYHKVLLVFVGINKLHCRKTHIIHIRNLNWNLSSLSFFIWQWCEQLKMNEAKGCFLKMKILYRIYPIYSANAHWLRDVLKFMRKTNNNKTRKTKTMWNNRKIYISRKL